MLPERPFSCRPDSHRGVSSLNPSTQMPDSPMAASAAVSTRRGDRWRRSADQPSSFVRTITNRWNTRISRARVAATYPSRSPSALSRAASSAPCSRDRSATSRQSSTRTGGCRHRATGRRPRARACTSGLRARRREIRDPWLCERSSCGRRRSPLRGSAPSAACAFSAARRSSSTKPSQSPPPASYLACELCDMQHVGKRLSPPLSAPGRHARG